MLILTPTKIEIMITQESIPYTADEIKAMVKTCEKYKEALEKLQEALAPTEDGCKISGLTRDCLENIFPELKESEGEKIRKALIEMIHDTTGDECEDSYHVSKESVLSWLEKQGEKKLTENAELQNYISNVTCLVDQLKKDFGL